VRRSAPIGPVWVCATADATSGEAHFTLNGREVVGRSGETVMVPAGARHSESNPGTEEAVGVVELRPALKSKELHEMFAGLRQRRHDGVKRRAA
jgi:hypothetical protein